MLRPPQENIMSAADRISKFQDTTPCVLQSGLSEIIGTETYAKIEYLNPVRSFKLRGAVNLVQQLAESKNISQA